MPKNLNSGIPYSSRILLFLPNRIYVRFYNWRRLKHGESVRLVVCGNILKASQLDRVWFTSKFRARLLASGLDHRGSAMFHMYHLSRIQFKDGDKIVDVGANTGDLLLGFMRDEIEINYCAIEPSSEEFQILSLNAPGHSKLFQVAAYSESKILDLHSRRKTASSSVIQGPGKGPKIPTRAVRLDDLDLGTETIKLLKVEAEGAEPEVLLGATKVLEKTIFVTIDCGFERGKKQESTEVEVVGILEKSGFCILEKYTQGARVCILFRNSNMQFS